MRLCPGLTHPLPRYRGIHAHAYSSPLSSALRFVSGGRFYPANDVRIRCYRAQSESRLQYLLHISSGQASRIKSSSLGTGAACWLRASWLRASWRERAPPAYCHDRWQAGMRCSVGSHARSGTKLRPVGPLPRLRVERHSLTAAEGKLRFCAPRCSPTIGPPSTDATALPETAPLERRALRVSARP